MCKYRWREMDSSFIDVVKDNLFEVFVGYKRTTFCRLYFPLADWHAYPVILEYPANIPYGAARTVSGVFEISDVSHYRLLDLNGLPAEYHNSYLEKPYANYHTKDWSGRKLTKEERVAALNPWQQRLTNSGRGYYNKLHWKALARKQSYLNLKPAMKSVLPKWLLEHYDTAC